MEGLRDGREETVKYLYQRFFPALRAFVQKNRGNEEDAKDLFQECLYYLYKYTKKNELSTIENLTSYFRKMYQNQWYVQLKFKTRQIELEGDFPEDTPIKDDSYQYIFAQAYNRLGKECQEVLRLYVEGKSTSELATILETTEDYAKRKKYLCKEQLKKLALPLLNKYLK